MKRNRLGRRGGLPRDAEQLLWLANGLADSSSRAEDHFWDQRLADAVDHLLRSEDEDALNTALDHLSTASAHAYDELADMIESRAEGALKSDDQHDVLLIAAPVMAWSRYRIPASPIAAAAMANLRVQLKAHVLAKDVKLALADFLFSPDQLPQGYCATADFATHLGKAAGTDTDLHIKTDNLPETAQFLSDTRYLLGAVVVPKGAPIFRWQEEDCTREQAQDQWRAQGGACFAPLLTGCAFEVVLPNAYFAASREADKASRPYSIQASVAFHVAPVDQVSLSCAPRARSCMAWCGRCWAPRTRAARPSPRSRPPCTPAASPTCWCSTTSSPWSTATTAAPPCTPPPTARRCMPSCPKNRPSRCRNICTDPRSDPGGVLPAFFCPRRLR